MPEVSKLSLNAGELSDEITGRIDLGKFNMGCETLENARVLRVGGVTRRAGLQYLGEVVDTDRQSRLVGFNFSGGQGYVLEFSHLKMRVIHAGVIAPTEYTTPWSEDQIFALQFAQRVDRIIVTHPEVAVHNIVRFVDGTWSVTEFPWVGRVWEVYPNAGNISLELGATTGSGISLTASGDLFTHSGFSGLEVDDRVRIDYTVSESTEEYYFNDVNPSQTPFNRANIYSEGDVVYSGGGDTRLFYTCSQDYDGGVVPDNGTLPADYPDYFDAGADIVPQTTVKAGWTFETFGTWVGTLEIGRSYDSGATWSVIKTITSNNNRNERVTETETEDALIRVRKTVGADNFRVEFTSSSYSEEGIAIITAISSRTVATVDVEKDFISTNPTTVWFEEAFSPRNGYPAASVFYQGRLCFAGTDTRPQTLWMSQTQAPFNFTQGTLATDAISLTTDANGYERITWLASHLSLLVGTTLGVWAVSSPDGNVVTPESNRINRQMQVGAEQGFQAYPVQNNVLFLQHRGRKIQELTGGSIEYGGYLSADLTQLASHITRGGVTQLATGQMPDSAMFLVVGGEIAVLTYERQQNVVGWSRWKTEGEFESIAVTSGANEDDDHYVIVKRGNKRFIEYMAPDMTRVEEDNDVANLRFLDCYTEKTSETEFTTIDGLDYLEGVEVEIFLDGEPQGTATVASGEITLPRAGVNAVVGLPYTTTIRPMPLDFGAIGSKSALYEAHLRFRNTLGGEASQDGENWSKIDQLQPRITNDVPLSLLSQDAQVTPHSTWERKPSISVRQTQALPMTVLAIRVKTKSSR